MDASKIPNLEGMDEQQAHRFLTEMFTSLSAEAEYELRHDDYVMEMPQSGERIRGRKNMREFQKTFADYSNPPTIRLRRVVVRDSMWILEGLNDYGEGQVFTVVAIFELKDGKIWRDTRTTPSRSTLPSGGPIWSSGWNPSAEALREAPLQV